MPATKRYMNWTGVTFTPVGGTAISITGVSSISIDGGGSLARFSGDGDRYNTTVVNVFSEPVVTIQAADIGSLRTLSVGAVGTLTATLNDAKNGTGSGAITYTMSNAVLASNPVRGAHRQFGQSTVSFTCFSSDGVTNPLSSTIAP